MADIQAKGKFNKKMEDGSWKYQRPNENPQAGGAQIKKWDSTQKVSENTTSTDTTKPINNEQGRQRVKNMLESKYKKKV